MDKFFTIWNEKFVLSSVIVKNYTDMAYGFKVFSYNILSNGSSNIYL